MATDTTTTTPAAPLTVSAVRTVKGTKATITINVTYPDGATATYTMGGNRAARAAAVWVRGSKPRTNMSGAMGCTADWTASEREATRYLNGYLYTYRHSSHSHRAEPCSAGWAMVEDASDVTLPAVGRSRLRTTPAPAPAAAPAADLLDPTTVEAVATAAARQPRTVHVAPGARAPRGTARFVAADHPDGYTCTCCGQHLPVAKFPTVSGPEVRGTRCRTCRDAAKAVTA